MEIIWDFDGTLFDTYPLMARSLMRALADEGRAADYPAVRAAMAVSLGEAFARFQATETTVARYRDYIQTAGPQGVAPFPGVETVLRRVVRQGGHNHIFTHRGRSTAWYLREHGLLPLFSVLVTSEDGLPRKPAPDGVLRVAARAGLAPERFVMVGDREIDIEAAHNAGARACRFAPEGEAPRTAAEYTLSDYSEFFDRLKEEEGR